MKTSRRAALTLMLALTLSAPAQAASSKFVDVEELMKPGPLPEQSMGSETAPVTIVEYASMTCGHCQAFHEGTFPSLKAKYIDTGKVRFILREFPLDPLASAAFMLARCAPSDDYFGLVDVLFAKQQEWAFVEKPGEALLDVATQVGFTEASFKACLADQKLLDAINDVKTRGAEDFGVRATPTFFINGVLQRGGFSPDEMDALIPGE